MSQLTPEDLQQQKLILFEAISGSRAYGLATPESDTDIRGVYMAPLEHLWDRDLYQAQVQDPLHNTVYYELGRYLELLSKNNPTVMELLASPADCIRIQNPLMSRIQAKDFLSQLCQQTFGQYAMAQIRKAKGLNKKINQPIASERKSVLDCCYVTVQGQSRALKPWLQAQGLDQRYCALVRIDHLPHLYALYHDAQGQNQGSPFKGYSGLVKDEATAGELCLSSVPPGEAVLAYLMFNLDHFQKYCREYKEYWYWVEQRNQERYQATLQQGENYDAKNMMHTFRLLAMAAEIASEKLIQVRRGDREFLLGIRQGQFKYEDLVAQAQNKMRELGTLYSHSDLPLKPKEDHKHELLIALRHQWFAV